MELDPLSPLHQLERFGNIERLELPGDQPRPPARPGEILVDEHVVKVDSSRIDALVEQISELVTASATAGLVVSRHSDAAGTEALETLARLVERVRDSALALRMTPIDAVFRRLSEQVDEMAKNIGLTLSGTETEIDKSMVDRLGDPLLRLVRHAIEHGIETEAERIALGKPARGTIRLDAWQETGNLVVEVSDDGRGLRIEPTGDGLDNSCQFEEVAAAEKDLEAFRGGIEMESAQGEGTTFRLRLPLTHSIIDGFRFLVGQTSYVVPLDSIQECADLPPGSIQAGVVRLREEPLPFLRLRELFATTCPTPSRESLVVVKQGPHRVGLVVDQLAGELQAVVKPLGALFHSLQAVSGTSVLGDGSVALVLDIPHLTRVVGRQPSTDRSNLANVQKSITTVELK